MDFIAYQKRLEYLLELIEKGKVSSPEDIANTFVCCEKTARNMVNVLREQNHNIKYCRRNRKYLLNNLER